MKNKRIIQNLALALTIATAGSFLSPGLVNAKSLDNLNVTTNTISTTSVTTIDQSLINKATPFIETTDNGFCLSQKGYSNLTSDEVNIVLNYINNSNAALKEAAKTGKLTKDGDKFIQSIDKSSTSSKAMKSTSTVKSTSSRYVDLTYTWWGLQIYFSSSAISDLKDWVFIGGSVSGFLVKVGKTVASGYLSSITLVGGTLAFAMAKVDRGNGVYLNCILYVPATLSPA